jgi:hypothetical protein
MVILPLLFIENRDLNELEGVTIFTFLRFFLNYLWAFTVLLSNWGSVGRAVLQ